LGRSQAPSRTRRRRAIGACAPGIHRSRKHQKSCRESVDSWVNDGCTLPARPAVHRPRGRAHRVEGHRGLILARRRAIADRSSWRNAICANRQSAQSLRMNHRPRTARSPLKANGKRRHAPSHASPIHRLIHKRLGTMDYRFAVGSQNSCNQSRQLQLPRAEVRFSRVSSGRRKACLSVREGRTIVGSPKRPLENRPGSGEGHPKLALVAKPYAWLCGRPDG